MISGSVKLTLRTCRLPVYAVHDGADVAVCSKELAEMFGARSEDELIGRDVFTLVAPEFRDASMAAILSREHAPYRSVGLRLDGSTFPMEVACTSVRFGADEGRLFTVRDLSPVALVVDDQAAVARMTGALMTGLGYQTLVYTTSREVIADFSPGIVSVMVSDIVMPDLDGFALVEQIRRVEPEVPVIFVTGYSERAIRQDSLTVTASKPFTIKDVEAALARLPARAREALA